MESTQDQFEFACSKEWDGRRRWIWDMAYSVSIQNIPLLTWRQMGQINGGV